MRKDVGGQRKRRFAVAVQPRNLEIAAVHQRLARQFRFPAREAERVALARTERARDVERLTGDGPENQSLPPEERLPPRPPPQANRAYLFDAVVEPSYRFEAQLTVRDFMPLEEVPERFARKVVVTVPADRATPAFLKGVRELFERHPGRVRTGVQVRLADGLRVTLDSAADLRVNPDAAFLEDAEKVVGGRNLHFGVAAAQTPGGSLRFDRGAPAPAAEDADETVVPVDPVRGTAAEEDAPVQEELLLEDA